MQLTMKKSLTIFVSILISTILYAQEQSFNALIIQFNDESQIAFILSEKPVVTVPDDKLSIRGVVNKDYNRSDVAKFFFESITLDDTRIATRVESVGKDNISFYYVDGETVRITGLKDKTMVSVASLDGKMISSCRSDASGEVTISLGNLPKGVYVVTFDKRSVKIIR